jgi:predicted amidohydrolase YtcJ
MTKKANYVFTNGAVYTVDNQRSWAQAVAVLDDKIVFVGSDNDVQEFISSDTVVLDLDRKMVLPGFVESHAHASHAMDLVGNISLYAVETIEDYERTINEFVIKHPDRDFYRGSGWSDTLFPSQGPAKEILDSILPNKPIALVSYDGHSMWVNSAALVQAQITKDTPDPDGGRIERDLETGEPSGTLRETAFKLVENVILDHTLEERKSALRAYQEMAARAGVTLCHDPMLDAPSISAFNSLAEENGLKMRFRGSVTMNPAKDLEPQIEAVLAERSKNTHPFFKTGTAKIFVDGVLEGGTAFLFEPYAHKPDFSGVPIWHPELLKEACQALDKENIQIHLHVIGDAAARITLDALEHAFELNGRRDARHLVTHLQLVDPDDILRFAELNAIGVPQPFWFKIDDYYSELALPYLGEERAKRQYPMKSFIDAGIVMASSSDFPVTIPFDPLIGIQTGITRSSTEEKSGKVLWPEERASLEEMLLSYTYNGAYANFLEDETGSIEVGKQADMIVVDQNLFNIPAVGIAKSEVLLTLVAGQEVYRAKSLG